MVHLTDICKMSACDIRSAFGCYEASLNIYKVDFCQEKAIKCHWPVIMVALMLSDQALCPVCRPFG